MENAHKNANRLGKTCMATMEKAPRPKTDYDAELKTWVQQVILEAEKNNDSEKKNQYLKLLKTFSASV
jgi:hypothetical protein